MNLGLTTSFVVGGILLLSILSMNMNLSQSSTELTMRQITQQRVNTIAEILQKDIPNIAYKKNGTVSSPIKDAQAELIEFESDIDNDGTVETITWEFTDTAVSSSQNPNDKILVRTVDGSTTEIKSGVTEFNLTYRDQNRQKIDINLLSSLLGGAQAERDKIRYITVDFTLGSPEKVGGAGNSDPHFIYTRWEKQFTPMNLRF